MSIAAAQGVKLGSLKVTAENRVDLSRSLGLSDNPVVEQVSLSLTIEADADRVTRAEIEKLARDCCPGAYCLTNAIPLTTNLEKVSGT